MNTQSTQNPQNKKLGLFALIGVILVTALAGGLYSFGVFGDNEPPPELGGAKGQGLQGFMVKGSSERGFLTFNKADVAQYEDDKLSKRITEKEIKIWPHPEDARASLTYFWANEPTKLIDIYKDIAPELNSETLIATYDPTLLEGDGLFTTTPNIVWKKITNIDPNAVLKKGQAVIVMVIGRNKVIAHDLNSSSDISTSEIDILAIAKKGWNLFGGLSRDQILTLDKASDPSPSSIWLLNEESGAFEKIDPSTLKKSDISTSIVWVKYTGTPKAPEKPEVKQEEKPVVKPEDLLAVSVISAADETKFAYTPAFKEKVTLDTTTQVGYTKFKLERKILDKKLEIKKVNFKITEGDCSMVAIMATLSPDGTKCDKNIFTKDTLTLQKKDGTSWGTIDAITNGLSTYNWIAITPSLKLSATAKVGDEIQMEVSSVTFNIQGDTKEQILDLSKAPVKGGTVEIVAVAVKEPEPKIINDVLEVEAQAGDASAKLQIKYNPIDGATDAEKALMEKEIKGLELKYDGKTVLLDKKGTFGDVIFGDNGIITINKLTNGTKYTFSVTMLFNDGYTSSSGTKSAEAIPKAEVKEPVVDPTIKVADSFTLTATPGDKEVQLTVKDLKIPNADSKNFAGFELRYREAAQGQGNGEPIPWTDADNLTTLTATLGAKTGETYPYTITKSDKLAVTFAAATPTIFTVTGLTNKVTYEFNVTTFYTTKQKGSDMTTQAIPEADNVLAVSVSDTADANVDTGEYKSYSKFTFKNESLSGAIKIKNIKFAMMKSEGSECTYINETSITIANKKMAGQCSTEIESGRSYVTFTGDEFTINAKDSSDIIPQFTILAAAEGKQIRLSLDSVSYQKEFKQVAQTKKFTTEDITGKLLTVNVTPTAITVSLDDTTALAASIFPGDIDVPMATFKIATTKDVTLTSMTLSHIGVGPVTDIKRIYIYNGDILLNDTLDPKDGASFAIKNGEANFAITKDAPAIIKIVADISNTATKSNQHGIKLTAISVSGLAATVEGLPKQGNTMAIAEVDKLTITANGHPQEVSVDNNLQIIFSPSFPDSDSSKRLAHFTLNAGNTAIEINSIKLVSKESTCINKFKDLYLKNISTNLIAEIGTNKIGDISTIDLSQKIIAPAIQDGIAPNIMIALYATSLVPDTILPFKCTFAIESISTNYGTMSYKDDLKYYEDDQGVGYLTVISNPPVASLPYGFASVFNVIDMILNLFK